MNGSAWTIIGLGAAGFAAYLLFGSKAQAETTNSQGSSTSEGTPTGAGAIVTKPGTRLSASDIAVYASAAGWQGDDLVTAVAVALAESGGNPNAYNPETAAGTPQGEGSFGLWQVYLKAHPEFIGQDLTDPQTNANAAFQVYLNAGQSFQPWSTFNGGQYAARLGEAQAGVNA